MQVDVKGKNLIASIERNARREEAGETVAAELVEGAQPPVTKEPWQMTREEWDITLKERRRQQIEEWNKAGNKGFPPGTRINTVSERIALAEQAGYVLPRDADIVNRIDYHKLSVEAAQKAGKPVPQEVLKEYPELQGQRNIPKAEAGMPEAGLSKDFWGYEAPVFPQGKGEVTQISMDDQVKLQEYYKQQGKQMPDATYAAVPVNSIEQLAAAPQFVELQPQAPSAMSENQRQAELKELIRDIKLIKAGRLDAYNKARSERRYELEKTRQAGIISPPEYYQQQLFIRR